MSEIAKWMITAVCPECGKVGTVRKILWGMPSVEAFESGNYIIGGCMVQGDGLDPKHGCTECDWEGTFVRGKVVIQ